MALQWADFPSGQQGLYGTDKNKMLNGVWGAFDGSQTQFITISEDPDPTIGAEGYVLKFAQTGSSGQFGNIYARFTYDAVTDVAGVAFRMWMNQYPVGDTTEGNPLWQFRTIANAAIVDFSVGASGQIRVHNSSGTLLYESDPAVLTTNAYNHVETKVLRHASAATIEVRVNGIVKVNLTGQALGATDIANVRIGQDNYANEPMVVYFKDIIFWDDVGSYMNDFVGALFVYDLVPDADDTLNWDPSVGATGYNLIDDVNPSNVLTATANVSDGNVVKIDTTYYRWSTGSLDSGSPDGTSGNPWRVLIGATLADSLSNMYKAIGASGVAGTDYSTALTAHATVNADGVTATQLSIEAKLATGASISCTETGSTTSWAASTMTGGPTDPSYISADNTPPPESIFTMTDLPDDVIAIRAVMPVGRLLKTDGGDCTVQMGVSPNGVDWDDGADRPVTVAATYYKDVSYISPDTSAAWTPSEVNDMVFRVDRTT